MYKGEWEPNLSNEVEDSDLIYGVLKTFRFEK